MTQIRFVTWNTNGIKAKLAYVLEVLDRIGADVAFIQETHVGPKCFKMLKNVKGWEVCYTVHSPRSKGVAILIREKPELKCICHDEDYSGGYIVLFCHLYGELYTLVNVYNHKKDKNILPTLKNYLMETNKGVLLVGGDFNTVLNPDFDRLTSGAHINFSSLRPMFEDFTASLCLRDIWSYFHPTVEGFTRKQNESQSRLDMFLMLEEAMERVINCSIESSGKSDHVPLILDLKVQKGLGSEKEIPTFASMLKDFKCNIKHDRKPGMISGAEILSAIKSLCDLEDERRDQLKVNYYKRFCCPMTEILKINYNLMIQNDYIPKVFTKSRRSGGRHIFNVDYLILTKILAKRLNVFITPSFRRRKNEMLDIILKVVLNRQQKEIHWSFLEASLKNLKQIHPAPPRDFSIVKRLLPAVKHSTGERRHLKNGCPLTKAILDLALKELENQILRTVQSTSVCFHRQTLIIHADLRKCNTLICILKQFSKNSGLKVQKSAKFVTKNVTSLNLSRYLQRWIMT